MNAKIYTIDPLLGKKPVGCTDQISSTKASPLLIPDIADSCYFMHAKSGYNTGPK